jgi:PAS domain S-box-containing protein
MADSPAVYQDFERTFQDFLESSPDAMVIVDPVGRIVTVNAQTEKLFGYSRDELAGQSVDALVPDRLRGNHAHHRETFVRHAVTRPMGVGLELFGQRKDGSEFPVEISLSPISTRSGMLVSSAIRDTTERKRFEQQLREKNVELEAASLAKDRFLTSMSHELRTPLNAIIGFTGTLLMRLPGPLTAEQERQLGIVRSSARHLLSLINDVLDIAKIESGKVELHLEPVPVADVIQEVVTGLKSIASEKGLELGFDRRPDQLVVRTDRRSLHQILINLVNNAIKYTPSGSVRIECEEKRASGTAAVEIRVIDTGIGIKADDQARIFQRFEMVDQSTTRATEGVGLGLYLSTRLAALVGATLRVQSAEGEGSTFLLSLPARQ